MGDLKQLERGSHLMQYFINTLIFLFVCVGVDKFPNGFQWVLGHHVLLDHEFQDFRRSLDELRVGIGGEKCLQNLILL